MAKDVEREQGDSEARSRNDDRRTSGNGAAATGGAESSTLRQALKAGAIAAAAGTTVAAAAKVMGARHGDETGRESSETGRQRSARVRGAARRGEPFVAAGWEAAKDSLLPLVESSAKAAGKFVADRSPDLVRESILPPFIEGFTQARERRRS